MKLQEDNRYWKQKEGGGGGAGGGIVLLVVINIGISKTKVKVRLEPVDYSDCESITKVKKVLC